MHMRYYIGTYTNLGGPGAAVIDIDAHGMRTVSVCRAIDNPGYLILTRDGKTVYTCASFDKDEKGACASYRVDGDRLIPLSLQPTGGKSACHACLSEDEDFLYITNYLSGSVSVFPVQDGYIMPRIQLVKHTGASRANPLRQEAAHPHQAVFMPGTNFLFVCDLGADEIVVYKADCETGLLIRDSDIKVHAGAGPRHLVCDGANRLYLGCELSNEIMFFEKDDSQWKLMQTVSSLPENTSGESYLSAVRRDRNRLFVSNRGYDSCVRFTLQKNGMLSEPSFIKIQGSYPRDVYPMPHDGILAANQKGNTVEWIEGGTTRATLEIKGAISILPAKEPAI